MIRKIKSGKLQDGNGRNAGRARSWWQKPLTCALWLLLGLPPVVGTAQEVTSNLLTTNSPFVLYLQNPLWIKEIRYVESQFYTIGDQGKIVETFWQNMTNRAGIQPTGFFIEALTTARHSPELRLIRGMSDRYYWSTQTNVQIGGNLWLAPKHAEEGGSGKNSAQIVGEEFQEKLERLRHFGLPSLLTNSFKLIGHDQFEAQTGDGYELDGKILAAADNHPLALNYTLGGSTNDVFTIKYAYSQGKDFPNYFEFSEYRNGRPYEDPHADLTHPRTNWIENVNYGLDENVANGYTPAMFYPDLTPFSITIWSNGMRYAVGQKGQRMAVPSYIPEFPTMEHKSLLPIVLLIFLLASGFLIWRFRSMGKD